MTTHPRATRRDLIAFYCVVALIALAGQALGAMEWLGWPWYTAAPAVAALEFGGVVLSRHSLARMQLGERAIAARAASAAVAAFAVVFNWLGHDNHMLGGFFAGMSALGYGVWLLDSGARRRDQLRQLGMLAAVPPAYGLTRWLRHPVLTREARALAIEHPTHGLHGSLAAARDARRQAVRTAAIAKVLHRKIRAAVDPTTADIAVNVYDLDEIARRLADDADYTGLTALIGADLAAVRIVGVEDTAPDMPADSTPATEPLADTAVTVEDTDPAPSDIAGGEVSRPRLTKEQAALTAQSLYLQNPDIALDIIAAIVERDVRTVRRYLEPIGRPTSAPPAALVTGPWPPRQLDPDAALAALEGVVDPLHRLHLADLALGGPIQTTSANGAGA